jgi:hypothetical protein
MYERMFDQHLDVQSQQSTGGLSAPLQMQASKMSSCFRDPEQIKYKTYQDYYALRWNQTNLTPNSPLIMGRAFAHHASSVNYLSPENRQNPLLHHQRECAAINAARLDPSFKPSGIDLEEVKRRWGGDGQGLMWPLLPPELCYVHWLSLQSVEEMQYLPSLMFRLEVRCLMHTCQVTTTFQWMQYLPRLMFHVAALCIHDT